MFSVASDAIDQKLLPRVIHNGVEIPGVGFGTFGSDHAGPSVVAKAVKEAISLGFRHIDCAEVYGNEPEIGISISEILSSGLIKRENLWITSKVWNKLTWGRLYW